MEQDVETTPAASIEKSGCVSSLDSENGDEQGVNKNLVKSLKSGC